MSRSILSFKNVTFALAAAALAAMTTGCAMTSGDALPANLQLSGIAMGGRQPIVGSAVTLYATGNSGYGSAATSLGTATTGATGTFTISRNANSCTGAQQLYLVAVGGDAGSGANTAVTLVEALGGCSSVTTSTTGLVINELTTVAAAYALQGFADTGVNIGTSSTNAGGLAHGFGNALNLVATNGTANSTTVGGNGIVPTAVINTIGNILASCVNSAGPSSTACTTILLGAPSVVGAGTPTNVWQEALNMARYPGFQTTALYGSVTTTGPFQTSLAAQPNDLSIGIAYSAGFQLNGTTAASFPWDIKADENDNIWVSGMTNAGLVELSPAGTLLSPSSGGWGNATLQAAFTHDLAFDTTANENVWAADNAGNIWEYTPAGTITAPTAGTTTQIAAATPKGPIGIGVDSNNNVWFATEGTASVTQGIGEVAFGASTPTYPTNGAYNSTTATAGSYTLFVDAANGNHLFAGTQTTSGAAAGVVYQYLAPATTAPVATASLGTGATNGVAVDKNAALWVVYTGSGSNGGSLSKFTPGNTAATYTCKVAVTGTGAGLYNPRGIVIDGSNRIFITSYTTPGIVEFDPALGTGCGDVANDAGTFFTASNAAFSGNGINPTNSAGTTIIATSAARNETVDASGALWTINGTSTAGYQPVIQVLGMSAPVNPVFAVGKYGVKP